VPTERFGSLVKSTFLRAVYGRAVTIFPPSTTPLLVIPEARDLRLMLSILVSVHDLNGLIALLRWTNGHAETFESPAKGPESPAEVEPPSDRELPPLRAILCAVRLFLEGSPASPSDSQDNIWFETPLTVGPEIIQEAKNLCQPFGWPSDDEVGLFLSREVGWMEGVARAADTTALKRSKQKSSDSSSETAKVTGLSKTRSI